MHNINISLFLNLSTIQLSKSLPLSSPHKRHKHYTKDPSFTTLFSSPIFSFSSSSHSPFHNTINQSYPINLMNRFNLTPGNKPDSNMGPPGLTRYGSAPGSLLASIADSVIGSQVPTRARGDVFGSEPMNMMSRFFPGDVSSGLTTSDSSCRTGPSSDPHATTIGNGSYSAFAGHHGPPIHDLGGTHKSAAVSPAPAANPLVRHSSSPAGLLSHLMVDPQGMGSYQHGVTDQTIDLLTNSRLRPQWSFSRQDSLSQLSDISIPDMAEGVTNSWAETGTIFPNRLGKRSRDDSDDFMASLGNMDDMEYMQMNQQDVAACKLRAKRGCATHPRSIAERERRTRISKRLRKLQELVPNMDKQTSTSDMLDIAVQYIKDLQGQLQKIKEEQQKCTCSSKVL